MRLQKSCADVGGCLFLQLLAVCSCLTVALLLLTKHVSHHTWSMASQRLSEPLSATEIQHPTCEGFKEQLSEAIRLHPAPLLQTAIVQAAMQSHMSQQFLSRRQVDKGRKRKSAAQAVLALRYVLESLVRSPDLIRCPFAIDASLHKAWTASQGSEVFIASNLHQSEHLMPHFVFCLAETAALLGTRLGFVSIYESGSSDATPCWLQVLGQLLAAMGVPNRVVAGGRPRATGEDRIGFLASMRCASK